MASFRSSRVLRLVIALIVVLLIAALSRLTRAAG